MKESHSDLILKTREILGDISQSELARQIQAFDESTKGLSQSTVSKWERDDVPVSWLFAAVIEGITKGKMTLGRFYPLYGRIQEKNRNIPKPKKRPQKKALPMVSEQEKAA